MLSCGVVACKEPVAPGGDNETVVPAVTGITVVSEAPEADRMWERERTRKWVDRSGDVTVGTGVVTVRVSLNPPPSRVSSNVTVNGLPGTQADLSGPRLAWSFPRAQRVTR